MNNGEDSEESMESINRNDSQKQTPEGIEVTVEFGKGTQLNDSDYTKNI